MRTASCSSSAVRRTSSSPTTVRTYPPRSLRISFLSAAMPSMRFLSARRATRSSQRFIPTTRTTARKRISSSRTLSTSSTAICPDGRTSTDSTSAPRSSRRPPLSRTTKSSKRPARSKPFPRNNRKESFRHTSEALFKYFYCHLSQIFESCFVGSSKNLRCFRHNPQPNAPDLCNLHTRI